MGQASAGASLTLCLGLVACAGTSPTLCTPVGAPDCADFGAGCAPAQGVCGTFEPGPTYAWVRIDSSPTSAAIYLDGRFIGYSPLRHAMSFTSATGRLRLVAVPLYPGQAQQERLVLVPPLPKQVSFFMNNPPADASGGQVSGDPAGGSDGGGG